MSNDEWQTPDWFLVETRFTMGAIDLDVCSSAAANKRVRAAMYFTKKRSCLAPHRLWIGRVFVQPPYSRGKLVPIVERLAHEIDVGHTQQAIALVNTDHSQAWWDALERLSSAFCLLRKRMAFIDPVTGLPGRSPMHAQTAFYCGPHAKLFRRRFCEFGRVYPGGTRYVTQAPRLTLVDAASGMV